MNNNDNFILNYLFCVGPIIFVGANSCTQDAPETFRFVPFGMSIECV